MIKYSSSSPYAETRLRSDYLDIYQKRDIPALDNDVTYTIQPQYTYRPDCFRMIYTVHPNYGGYLQ